MVRSLLRVIVPCDGAINPQHIFKSVVFPLPLGPIMVTIWDGSTANDMLSSIFFSQ